MLGALLLPVVELEREHLKRIQEGKICCNLELCVKQKIVDCVAEEHRNLSVAQQQFLLLILTAVRLQGSELNFLSLKCLCQQITLRADQQVSCHGWLVRHFGVAFELYCEFWGVGQCFMVLFIFAYNVVFLSFVRIFVGVEEVHCIAVGQQQVEFPLAL